jgi:signal transduction histidine kinase
MSKFRLRSIGSKILIRTILVVLLPLVVLSGIVLYGLDRLEETAANQVEESRSQLSRESVAVNAQDQSVSVAREINSTLLERIEDVTSWARNPAVVDGARAANEFAQELELDAKPIEELEADYNARRSTGVAPTAERFLITELEYTPEFGEVFFTDANGYNAALTNLTSDFVQSDEDWWQDAWVNGISVSDVEFDESSNTFSVDVSVRIDDGATDERLGVMKASLSVAFVQSIATARSIGSVEYTVALTDGLLIAETETFHNNDRMMVELPEEQLSEGLIRAIDQGGAGSLVTEETVWGFTRTTEANFLGSEVQGFKGLDWIVLSSQRADVAFSPLRGLQTVSDEIESSKAGLRGTIIIAVLVGVVVAAIISRLLARGIVGPVRRLTTAASNAANTNLPNAVVQIDEAGGDLDSVEVPEIELETGDELERLASSFNSVQGTALRLASEQALNRRNTADMFVNLGRRNNSLLKRQLRFIDGLERNEADPDTLDSLFKLDHLATRMRRNAESLLVLAGERSPRRWSAPVPMKDAVQSALAEVEEYERADITQIGAGTLQGNVVADVAHVLAELVENALTFSPPQTDVVLNGRETDDGYILTVSDEGIGMADEELQAANDRLAAAFELSQVPAQHIGLFVVGRLARQHGIAVSLSRSPSGGTTATIELPEAITSASAATQDGGDDEAASESVIPDETVEAPTETEAETGTVAEAEEIPEADARVTSDASAAATGDGDESDDAEEDAGADEPDDVDEPNDAEDDAEDDGSGDDEPLDDGLTVVSPESDSDDAPDDESADGSLDDGAPVDESPDASAAPVARRAGDEPGSPVADSRRGPDDPPVESVVIGDVEIPRRQQGGKARSSAPSAHPSVASDEPTTAPNEPDPKLDAFGFRKRDRKKDKASATTQVEMVAKVGGDEDVEETAAQSRNQWSSFQKGKETAESEPSQSTESATPDEQGA